MPADTSPDNGSPDGGLLAAAHEHRGGALLDAIAAACALVTHADARESVSERLGVRAVQQDDPLLAALPADELTSRLALHAEAWREDPAAARAAALSALAPMAADPNQAKLVLAACARMPRADGKTESCEVDAVLAVREALGLAP